MDTDKRDKVWAQPRGQGRDSALLLSAVAHEIRTPLTIIRTYASALLDHGLGELDGDLVRRIDASARQAEALIQDLSQASLLQAGRVRFQPQRLELAQFLRQALPDFHAVAPGRPVLLEIEDESAVVRADPVRLTELLLNLVENAHKYSRECGPVRVRTSSRGARRVVAVEDAGPGLPSGEMPRMFDAFYRGTNSSGTTGTGLGLTLCRLLAKGQDGEIWAEHMPAGRFQVGLSLPPATPAAITAVLAA